MAEIARYTLRLPAEFAALRDLREVVHHAGEFVGLSEKETHDLMLAADEAATNIVKHARDLADRTLSCALTANKSEHSLTIELQYQAKELFAPDPPTAVEIEERLRGFQRGGLGLFLIHRLVDSIDYLHDSGCNVIRMLKKHVG